MNRVRLQIHALVVTRDPLFAGAIPIFASLTSAATDATSAAVFGIGNELCADAAALELILGTLA
jgi:hypothetical protein